MRVCGKLETKEHRIAKGLRVLHGSLTSGSSFLWNAEDLDLLFPFDILLMSSPPSCPPISVTENLATCKNRLHVKYLALLKSSLNWENTKGYTRPAIAYFLFQFCQLKKDKVGFNSVLGNFHRENNSHAILWILQTFYDFFQSQQKPWKHYETHENT